MPMIACNIQDLDLTIGAAILYFGQMLNAFEVIYSIFGVYNSDSGVNFGSTFSGLLKLFDFGNLEANGTRRSFPLFKGKTETGSLAITFAGNDTPLFSSHALLEAIEEIVIALEKHYDASYEQNGGIEYNSEKHEKILFLEFLQKLTAQIVSCGTGFIGAKKAFIGFLQDSTNTNLEDDFIHIPEEKQSSYLRQQDSSLAKIIEDLMPAIDDEGVKYHLSKYLQRSLISARHVIENSVLEKWTSKIERKEKFLQMSSDVLAEPTNAEEKENFMKVKMILSINQNPEEWNLIEFENDSWLVEYSEEKKTFMIQGERENEIFSSDCQVTEVLAGITAKTVSCQPNLTELFQKVAEHEDTTMQTLINTTRKYCSRRTSEDGVFDWSEIALEERKQLFSYIDVKKSGSLAKCKNLISVNLIKEVLNEKLPPDVDDIEYEETVSENDEDSENQNEEDDSEEKNYQKCLLEKSMIQKE
jgi:hypothetical protein